MLTLNKYCNLLHCTCKLFVVANITRSSIILAAHFHALYKYFHKYTYTHSKTDTKKKCATLQAEQTRQPQRAHVIVIIVLMHITKHTLNIVIENTIKERAKDIISIKKNKFKKIS